MLFDAPPPRVFDSVAVVAGYTAIPGEKGAEIQAMIEPNRVISSLDLG
jgi:hypothetical protein